MKKLLLLIVLLPSVALAAPRFVIPPIPIRIAYVDGPGALGVPMVERIIDAATAVFRKVRIPAYREKSFYFNNWTPECRSVALSDRVTCLRQWMALLRNPLGIPGGVLIVVTPPLNGSFWAGIANGIGAIGSRESIVVANLKERFPGDPVSFGISATVAGHEIGHALGMEHDDRRCTMMHSAAAACVKADGKPVKPSGKSVAEAMRWLRLRLGRRVK